MATALYRRYRSARFGDLLGQDVIATTLRNEVRGGSLAHAYLFTGIRGTGKTSTARILARAVNCLDLRDGEPCNRCGACVEILDGASVDVLEIDAASNRGIEEMRDLREKVRYLPASLRCKVYIIDEAHMLTTEAWNAFLKTLEEPPPHVLFVLATTEPHKVPETVRSRVQRFDFRRVSMDDMVAHLRRILETEGRSASADGLAIVAAAAQGSVRDALSMLDQALASVDGELSVDAVRRALGLADSHTLNALLEALAGGDGAAALRAVAAAFDAGADPRQLLREVSRRARAAEFAALGHAVQGELSDSDLEAAAALARVAPRGFWLRALELLQDAELQLRQPMDARLQVEYVVMRLVHDTGPLTRVDELEERIARLEHAAGAPGPSAGHEAGDAPGPPARSTVTPGPAATQVTVDTVSAGASGVRSATPLAPEQAAPAPGDEPADGTEPSTVAAWQERWTLLLEAINRRDRALAGVLRDCRPVAADAGSLTVGAPYNFHLERLNERHRLALLTEAAGEVAGSPRAVDTRYVGEGVAPARPGGTGEATQAVLDAFAGSRVTSTRLRDHAGPSQGGPA